MTYIQKRFSEPSTWAGMAIVASQTLLASGLPNAALLAGLVAGLAAVIVPERAGVQ